MDFEPKTIAEHIDCLARLTGARQSFVIQVRDLFSSKGISLDADATPYLRALDEAFTREQSIRENTERARRNLVRSQRDFTRIGKAYVRRVEQLQRAKNKSLGRRSRNDDLTPRSQSTEVAVTGGHRMVVTRPQRDTLPMVPGPTDPQ